MINRIRYIWQILILCSLLVIAGILLLPYMAPELSLTIYFISLLSVATINVIAFLVMTLGMQKHDREGMVILFGGVGLKFLLYLLYILVFWLVTKNLSKPFIITFFALYLVFTFLLAGNLLKGLKNK